MVDYNDTGLAAHILGIHHLPAESPLRGQLLELFVGLELIKQLSFWDTQASLFHFRTHAGQEVDFVVERNDGCVVGIEVKHAASVSHNDFKGLIALRESAGTQFHRGCVLYRGATCVPFGDRLFAVPVACLWE